MKILKIKVIPNSPITRISTKKFRADLDLVIELAEIPEEGKANKELIRFLLQHFECNDVRILTGKTSRIKLVEII